MAFIRGQAVTGFPFELVTIGGQPITSGTVTGYYLIDGGAQATLTGTATHEGNGQWSWSTIPATAMDGELIGLLFVHAEGRASFTIRTTTTPYGELIAGTPSEVELCNLALMDLGAEAIESFTDDSDRARLCRHVYPDARDELLADIQPHTAVRRSVLAQTTTPISTWAYAFALPSGCLKPLDIDDETYAWLVEGNTLVTDKSTVTLRYVYRLEDVTQYPQHFKRALIAYLTARMTYPITKSGPLKESNYRLFQIAKQEALALEGQEGTPTSTANTVLTTDVRS